MATRQGSDDQDTRLLVCLPRPQDIFLKHGNHPECAALPSATLRIRRHDRIEITNTSRLRPLRCHLFW
jgi:hypothetical protein